MKPALAPGDLAGLDALEVDALVVPLFEARAQPQGVAGNVDWRLSGRIARLLQSGRFTGRRGEVLLMTALERISAARLFLWGLGPAARWPEPDLATALAPLVRVLADAAVESAAVALPWGTSALPSAWQAASLWAPLGDARVVLLDGATPAPARASLPPPPPA